LPACPPPSLPCPTTRCFGRHSGRGTPRLTDSPVLLPPQNLGFINPEVLPRELPWRPSANLRRKPQEGVRPIFWANRRHSYLARTTAWESYPSGRWASCALRGKGGAFGPVDEKLMSKAQSSEKRREKAMAAWGKTVTSLEDVKAVFANYVLGEIKQLPWTESDRMQSESTDIAGKLVAIIKQGYLTINSQPRVNGLPSSDAKVGWGGEDGFVYQKAYMEFFCSPAALETMLSAVKKIPSISYQVVNAKGEYQSNMAEDAVVAVTWGVFPNKEIMQPTVVDASSFKVWKDEAFALWTAGWASLYEANSVSQKVLGEIKSSYFLVSLLDNNYVDGDLFKVFP